MFSFFLRSKLVVTNLLQFIKFLSRTQSLFYEGENRKLSPGAVRLYYVRSEPGVHIHTPIGRIYRTMQPAAYQRIVTPYMPGRAKAAKKPDIKKSARQTCLTDFFCTPRRTIPPGARIILFCLSSGGKATHTEFGAGAFAHLARLLNILRRNHIHHRHTHIRAVRHTFPSELQHGVKRLAAVAIAGNFVVLLCRRLVERYGNAVKMTAQQLCGGLAVD